MDQIGTDAYQNAIGQGESEESALLITERALLDAGASSTRASYGAMWIGLQEGASTSTLQKLNVAWYVAKLLNVKSRSGKGILERVSTSKVQQNA